MSTAPGPSADWSIELLYRPLRCGAGEEHVVLRNRLRRLELAGVVDDVTIRRMGHELALSGTVDAVGHGDETRRRIVEFLGWARRNGVTIPGLRRKDAVGVGRMGPSHPVVELPATLLGIYRDDELVWVLPGEYEGRTYTIADWLDAVADRDRPVAGGEPLETVAYAPPSRSVTFTRCGGLLRSWRFPASASRPRRASGPDRHSPRRPS